MQMDIFNYSEVKNIISVNSNFNISIYSSELQAHIIYTPSLNGLMLIINIKRKVILLDVIYENHSTGIRESS